MPNKTNDMMNRLMRGSVAGGVTVLGRFVLTGRSPETPPQMQQGGGASAGAGTQGPDGGGIYPHEAPPTVNDWLRDSHNRVRGGSDVLKAKKKTEKK